MENIGGLSHGRDSEIDKKLHETHENQIDSSFKRHISQSITGFKPLVESSYTAFPGQTILAKTYGNNNSRVDRVKGQEDSV